MTDKHKIWRYLDKIVLPHVKCVYDGYGYNDYIMDGSIRYTYNPTSKTLIYTHGLYTDIKNCFDCDMKVSTLIFSDWFKNRYDSEVIHLR